MKVRLTTQGQSVVVEVKPLTERPPDECVRLIYKGTKSVYSVFADPPDRWISKWMVDHELYTTEELIADGCVGWIETDNITSEE